MRATYWRPENEDEFDNDLIENTGDRRELIDSGKIFCSVSTAKKYLKKFGGVAWMQHHDRSGQLFESTQIHLKGNNSTHKYNRHL